jgi:putative N6-adenine-specific DNA methylase
MARPWIAHGSSPQQQQLRSYHPTTAPIWQPQAQMERRHRRDTAAERKSGNNNNVDVDFYQQHVTRKKASEPMRRSFQSKTTRVPNKKGGRMVRASFVTEGSRDRWSKSTGRDRAPSRGREKSWEDTREQPRNNQDGRFDTRPSRGGDFGQHASKRNSYTSSLSPDNERYDDTNNEGGNWKGQRQQRHSGDSNGHWKDKREQRNGPRFGRGDHQSGENSRDKGRWKGEGSRYLRRKLAQSQDGGMEQQQRGPTSTDRNVRTYDDNLQASGGTTSDKRVRGNENDRTNRFVRGETGDDRTNRIARGERGQGSTKRPHEDDRTNRFARDERGHEFSKKAHENDRANRFARDGRGHGQQNKRARDNDRVYPRSRGSEQDAKRQFAAELQTGYYDERPKEQRRAVQVRRTFPPDQIDAYVACHPGLEAFLCQELTALGIAHKVKGFGATLISPSVDDMLNCHLYLGTASNVFLRCGEPFSARALGELERKVELIPWNKILSLEDDSVPRFHFKVTSAKSRLLHNTAIRDKVLVGIYKSLGYNDFEAQKDANNAKGDAVENDQPIRLTVQFFRDKVQISIDTSDTPIHQRAYRLETAKAPLREDLAFAFLYGAGWKPAFTLTADRDETRAEPAFTSFLDPFCGSGTLAIEAAAMAAGLPPGRLRPAPLKGTSLYNPGKWESLVADALHKSTRIDASEILIRASDRDKGAVRATKSNAERAGVLGQIEAEDCAFTAHPWLDKPSNTPGNLLLAANLPFGRRISAPSKHRNYLKHPLLPLYQSLANHFNSLSDAGCQFGAVLLTDDRELLRLGGFCETFDTTLSTKHGGIPVSGMFMKSAKVDSGGVM